MNLNVNAEVRKVIELIDKSPRLYRLAFAVVAVLSLYPISAVIKAIRWW